MSAELLPCPCGRPAYFHDSATLGKYVIACKDDDCYWSMTGYSKDALTVLWNRRAPAPEQPAAQGDGSLFDIEFPNDVDDPEVDPAIAALQRQPADADRVDVAAQLEAWANNGLCPALVFDDDGRWAVTFDGISAVPPEGGHTEDVTICAVVGPEQWRDSVLAAIDSARAEVSST